MRVGDNTYESPGLQHILGINVKKWRQEVLVESQPLLCPLVWHFVGGTVCIAGGQPLPSDHDLLKHRT